MRTVIGLLVLAGMSASPAWSQQTLDAEASRRETLFEERKGDFDYLLGAWRISAHHAEWGTTAGYWTAVRLSSGDGTHILDEYRLVGDEDDTFYVSTTLRAYNETTGVWELVSADRGTGLLNMGTARKVDDEMHIEQRFGVASGKPELWRIRYYDIRADRFSWVAYRSLDDGVTWEPRHLTIEAQRIGPARSLEPLAVPQKHGRR